MWNDIEHPWLLALSVVLIASLARAWAILLFGSIRRTAQAVRWVFRRDSDSLVRGDYLEDKLAEVRLALLLALSGVTVIALYEAVQRFIDWVSG